MSVFEIAGTMLAGLGLFFYGIKTLTNDLEKLTGRRFRRFVERSTRNPLLSMVGGVLLGATIQTGSAITFILVGMAGAGMISVERSLPVRLGAAVGTSTMVFIATMNIKMFILYVLGIAGIGLAQSRTSRPLLGVFFGGGMMFFGLNMIVTSATAVTGIEWFQNAITSVNGAPLGAFMLAAMLSLLTQSPLSVAILAIAMTVSGVLDTWTTMVIIYGASFGGGLITYLMATGFKGSSRQIMMFQVLFNAGTGLVLFFFFFLERYYQLPFIHAFVTSLNVDLAQQMAFIYLIFNVLGAIVMFVFRAPILKKIQHFCPPSTEDNIGKLEYLHDRVFDTPDLALDLAEKEVFRFFSILPEQIEALRVNAETGAVQSDALTRALNQRHDSIDEALTELAQYVSAEDSEGLINLANRHRILGSLHSSIDNFSNSVLAANKSEHLSLLATTVIEAFDASLCLAVEAATENDRDELELAWKSTDDKSDKMRNIRSRFLTGGVGLSDSERLDLMALTTSLERAVWVLHELLGDMLANGRVASA